jgi:apolipoprotein N-acyltransferase
MHDDAQIILNPTNGSSYWLSQVQTEQLASSVLRAVESGRWLIQAAPTGFSEIIDPAGNVLGRTAITEAAVVQHDVELRDGHTIAVVVGDVPAAAIAILWLITAWAGLPRRNHGDTEHRHGRAEP